jgi:hypothetical protein
MKRSLLAASLLPALAAAQSTEFGNIRVIQNDAGNNTTSVTVTKEAGSSPNLAIRSGSTKADYNLTFGNGNDYDTGVPIASIAENGRNNNSSGETIGTFYSTVSVDVDSATTPNRYLLALFRSPNADEQNQNTTCAFFSYQQWPGGIARNAAGANGGVTDTLKASAGINLGTQFTSAGSGVFGLNLTSINPAFTPQNGILLVNHFKNEDNYAASFVNGSGFTMHVRDNGSTGTAAAPATEQDPIAFVYLHTTDVGTKYLKAMGRVNNDASTDVAGGAFTVTKGGTGQWHLSIPGMSPANGTLIVSPEGGATNNVDNIVSHQWDAANSRYVIESRDIVSTSAVPVPEDGATGGEDMFSFAFFGSPAPPTVAITTPANGATVLAGTGFSVGATAADPGGNVTQVEFLRDGVVVGTDTDAPYVFNQAGLAVGTYSFMARATDNDGFTTASAAVSVNVTLDPNNLPENTALWFDGVNDYVTMGAAPDLGAGGPPANGFTLECWFRRDGAGTTASSGSSGVTAAPLFGKGRSEGDGSNVDCNYFFGITAGGILVADFEAYPAAGITAGQNHPVTATHTPITNGTWNHAAVTYDGATFTWKIYLNAVQVGSAPAVAGALPRYDSIQHFGIGTAMTSTGAVEGAFHGIIDEVRVWNHARSASDIAATKNVAIASSPGLVGRYGLNEGIGTTTASSTGTSAGTLTNGPLWIEGAAILENDAPGVSITAPSNNASFNAPAAFTIIADAQDPDGSISKVEFFLGATKIGEDITPPYELPLSGLVQGNYSYTARATDNLGTFTNSSAIAVEVLAPLTTPPTVAITSPAGGASFLAPATVTISADAADSDGTVAKVEFFSGSAKLGEDTDSPYTFTWSNVAAGAYSLTARATDNLTAATTSSPVAVNVAVNQAPAITPDSPADLATGVGSGGQVTLSASVSDPENQPLSVTFYGRLKLPPVGPDFALVTLPDTQYYSQNSGGTRLANFISQTNWIVANRTALNIPFVAHMGDMVQNGDAVEQEWINADSAMDILENPVTTLLAHGIPWGGAPGNHDQQPIGSPDGASVFWNTYFGTSRWAGRSYWGGNYSTNNDNNYQLFSASGLDFIIINLEYRPSANQAVLDWADALLKAHPNRRAIITSHWLIGTGNPAAWGGHGQAVHDNLKDNPNLFLLLCGHIHGEGRRSDVFEGRTVHTVLQDYQDRANGGDSWLRYFVFSPAANTISARTLQTTTNTFETDADSQFTLPYTMGPGSTPWTALGTVNASAGTATLDWTGLAGSTAYEWYAAVSDGPNSIGSATRSFTTAANTAPSVSLTSPANGATIALPATVNFAASAGDSDGTVAKVEFFSGTTKAGEDTMAPYDFQWTAGSGSHALTAVVTDNQGATATSAAVNVTVTNPANIPPTVAVTMPGSGASVPGPHVTLEASAGDTDGTVSKVEFFSGTTELGVDFNLPYSMSWLAVPAGNHTITAVATDNDGGTTTSAPVSFTVEAATDLTFQQNVGGYTGTVDTALHSDPPAQGTAYGNDTSMSIDGDDGSSGTAPNQGLIRFDNIIGPGPVRIPMGSTINGATLTFTVSDPGSGMNLHRMLSTWSETSTWTSMANGIQTDGIEAVSAILATVGANDANANVPLGPLALNVTSAVQAWANGADNHGFALIPFVAGTNGIDIHSSESDTILSRPQLAVTFVPPPTVNITASDATAGEHGADQTLAFAITRTGPTTGSLNVPLIIGGSATAGTDYSGGAAGVTIPASQASVSLPLAILPDNHAEGPETVTIAPGSSPDFIAGTSAMAIVADHPAQDFFFHNIANPALRDATADADDDASANIVEYFMGTLPADANSRGILEIPSTGANTFKVRYPRARNRPAVSGALQWSAGLDQWHAGGETDGTWTVTFSEAVVSAPAQDPETVEATATITGGTQAPRIFVRLGVR